MSEKYKFVTVKGQEYRIEKFSALHGTYVLAKISGVIASALSTLVTGMGGEMEKPGDLLQDFDAIKSLVKDVDIRAMFLPLSTMSEEDFMYVQKKCLSACHVQKQIGYVPTIYDNGSFSVPELEDDTFAVMALIAHALIHNFAGFISGSLSSALASDTPDTNPQDSPT